MYNNSSNNNNNSVIKQKQTLWFLFSLRFINTVIQVLNTIEFQFNIL